MKDKIIQLLLSDIPANIELALQLYKGMIGKEKEFFNHKSILFISVQNQLCFFNEVNHYIDLSVENLSFFEAEASISLSITIIDYEEKEGLGDALSPSKIAILEDERFLIFTDIYLESIERRANSDLTRHSIKINYTSNIPFNPVIEL